MSRVSVFAEDADLISAVCDSLHVPRQHARVQGSAASNPRHPILESLESQNLQADDRTAVYDLVFLASAAAADSVLVVAVREETLAPYSLLRALSAAALVACGATASETLCERAASGGSGSSSSKQQGTHERGAQTKVARVPAALVVVVVSTVHGELLAEGLLDQRQEALREALLRVEPTYDAVTAARDGEAWDRNAARVIITSRFRAVDVVLAQATSSAGLLLADRLEALVQGVATAAAAQQTTRSDAMPQRLAHEAAQGRVQSLVAAAAAGDGDSSQASTRGISSTNVALSSSDWADTTVRALIQEYFFQYCQSRSQRLTPEMVDGAYAATLLDCERVCSAAGVPCDATERMAVGRKAFLATAAANQKLLQQQRSTSGAASVTIAVPPLHQPPSAGNNAVLSLMRPLVALQSRVEATPAGHLVRTTTRAGARAATSVAAAYGGFVRARVSERFHFLATGRALIGLVALAVFLFSNSTVQVTPTTVLTTTNVKGQ